MPSSSRQNVGSCRDSCPYPHWKLCFPPSQSLFAWGAVLKTNSPGLPSCCVSGRKRLWFPRVTGGTWQTFFPYLGCDPTGRKGLLSLCEQRVLRLRFSLCLLPWDWRHLYFSPVAFWCLFRSTSSDPGNTSRGEVCRSWRLACYPCSTLVDSWNLCSTGDPPYVWPCLYTTWQRSNKTP